VRTILTLAAMLTLALATGLAWAPRAAAVGAAPRYEIVHESGTVHGFVTASARRNGYIDVRFQGRNLPPSTALAGGFRLDPGGTVLVLYSVPVDANGRAIARLHVRYAAPRGTSTLTGSFRGAGGAYAFSGPLRIP